MMRKIGILLLLSASGYLLTGCNPTATPASNAGNTSNTASANANAAAKPAPPPASKDALIALEKSGWDAWKNKDTKVFEDLLSDKAVGFGKDGREDKAAIIKDLADSKCDVKSYSFSDEQMTPLGNDVAVLTFKGTQDATCNVKKNPPAVWSASVYVREGDKWKNYLYIENPVTDPKNPPKYAVAKPAAKSTTPADAVTDQVMAIEKKAWDSWKQRDKAGIESVMGNNFVYFSGTGYTARADALKLWGDSKCQGLDYSFSDPKGFSVAPDVSVATYRADVKGKCDGSSLAPTVWVASFDMKEGDQWKNAFYIELAPTQ
ncbi:MAG: nuclear transport factor 2 family protein [Acidobacteria bacterium]|nr:nuclear transport factor 2 family protein [Acidobacteriota bacterium]